MLSYIRKCIQFLIQFIRKYLPGLFYLLKNNDFVSSLHQTLFPLTTTIHYDEEHLRLKEYLHTPKDGRIVFYTAIAGEYSRLLPPARLMPGARYVCFSDSPKPTYGIWAIRPLPKTFAESPRWASRWCKLHPHELFPDAEVVIWLDGNIVISGDMEAYIQRVISSGLPVGMIRHPERRCVYEEIAACLRLGKDSEERLERQRQRYVSLGLPAANGLYETNVIINNIKHPGLSELYDAWWRELSEQSWRDQISLAYVLHALRLTPCEFLPEGISAQNSEFFIFLKHEATFRAHIDDQSLFSTEVTFPSPPVSFAEYGRQHPHSLEAAAPHRADVIVPVHNALGHARACFASLLPTLRAKDGLIIVNDLSDAETSGWLRAFAQSDARVRLLENETNLGYTGSANRGLRASDAPFRVMLNSDTVVCPGWLEKMLLVAYGDDKTGIVGPLSNAASYQSVPSLSPAENNTPINVLPRGKSVRDMDRLCEESAPWGLYPSVALIHGFCFGIRQEVINTIGFFDEINFGRFFGEENDYSLRAAQAGFILRVATPVYVYHAKSKSISTEIRTSHVGKASRRLHKIYGTKRVNNAIYKTLNTPILIYMRNIFSKFYNQCDKNEK
ncbi:glycosyltransferase [uncultured Desulfovibrio sp.]|uniref:glycosyltransferase n=1 Tax=uncultured Desulfovibrio sp. TaxID=167968 RepID=UPI002670B445|nr:glycosyltransferase [uncultured Desulfovibrio sp.]